MLLLLVLDNSTDLDIELDRPRHPGACSQPRLASTGSTATRQLYSTATRQARQARPRQRLDPGRDARTGHRGGEEAGVSCGSVRRPGPGVTGRRDASGTARQPGGSTLTPLWVKVDQYCNGTCSTVHCIHTVPSNQSSSFFGAVASAGAAAAAGSPSPPPVNSLGVMLTSSPEREISPPCLGPLSGRTRR